MFKRKLHLAGVLLMAPVALVMAMASTGTALALDKPWSGSGTGATTVVSDGSAAPAAFHYDVSVYCCASGAWSFGTTAATTRTVVLKYNYTGYHAFYQVRVNLNAIAGANIYPLVADGPVNCCTPPSGGFSYTGMVTVNVLAGQNYGFTMSGGNYDSDGRLIGTLTVDELNANDCKNTGWMNIKDTTGNPLFKNQGDCVSFAASASNNAPSQ